MLVCRELENIYFNSGVGGVKYRELKIMLVIFSMLPAVEYVMLIPEIQYQRLPCV